jgi:raffinose/stachyose/melibiose transport system substrate-binding protein
MNSFSPDGKIFGGSGLYGVSDTADLTGVFYNRAKLRALGSGMPKTFAEFQALLAKAKGAGQTPIMFGNQDKWPVIHQFQMIWEIMAPTTYLYRYIFGQGNESFNTPAAVKAATTLQNWSKSGYFEDGFNGVGQSDAWQRFAKGEGVFLLGGTWLNSDIAGLMGKNVGFFAVPPLKAGGPAVTIGSGANPFSISSKSNNQKAAAAWLNYLTSVRAAKITLKYSSIPATHVPTGSVPSGTSQADILSVLRKVSADNGVIPYMDFSTPSATIAIGNAGGELLGGRTSPKDFVAKIEDDYKQFKASRH